MTFPCACECCAARAGASPGRTRLTRRLGDHASFFASMTARLSASDRTALAALGTRDLDDPSIALLDAWAVVGDVLTFYQERIADEGYLRTATERRSLYELARLVGYRPRPGVSASAHLAFALENESPPANIPRGTRVNSIPLPGEQMVAFETEEPIVARREWARIRPRMSLPQTRQSIEEAGGIYLAGTATRLKPNDALLVRWAAGTPLEVRRILEIREEHEAMRTFVRFALSAPPEFRKKDARTINNIRYESLLKPDTVAPRNRTLLERNVAASFAPDADLLPRLLAVSKPAVGTMLFRAFGNAPPPVELEIEVYALRIEARAFGYNSPPRQIGTPESPKIAEWAIEDPLNTPSNEHPVEHPHHGPRVLYLDNDYDIATDSIVLVEAGPGKDGVEREPLILNDIRLKDDERRLPVSIHHVALHAYGLSGKSALLGWKGRDDNDPENVWLRKGDTFTVIRQTRVLTGSEQLELALAPIDKPVEGTDIELDGLFEGLEPGRWLIVEGERVDITDANGLVIPGIGGAELVMLDSVAHVRRTIPIDGEVFPLPGDTLHSVVAIKATTPDGKPGLAHIYKRDSVVIHGNVARATHGEARAEILGSGNAAEPLQGFVLKQPPLTHVPAATPSGIASTMELRVNGILWHEHASLATLAVDDRGYVTRQSDDGQTIVTFGDGRHGARLPTGQENVKALYRSGIGAAGNVKAQQLKLLASRPLGVKDVTNPIPASGGADAEGSEAIRANVATALHAFDRLLSTSDYADFARSFAGIGKASATRSHDGRRSGVKVVIAGAADAPIETSSERYGALKDALHRFGEDVPVQLTVRDRLMLVVKANVGIDPDYQWELVEPKLRKALLDALSFDRAEIGRSISANRAIAAIHGVKGVVYADLDIFSALNEKQILGGFSKSLADGLKFQDVVRVDATQIAYLAPTVEDTLILQEVKP